MHCFGEDAGLLEIGIRRLPPEEIGVAGVGKAAGDAMVERSPSGVREPGWMKGRSRSSTSEVMRRADSASVRATMSVETPMTSAARRAAVRLRSWAKVGIRTLSPR